MNQQQSAAKSNPAALAPILVFLALYLGSGITFEYILKIENGFYQTPAIVIFLIALAVACFQNRKLDFNAKLKVMASGVADENILTMCLVFLAAGAFSGAISAGRRRGQHRIFVPYLPAHLCGGRSVSHRLFRVHLHGHLGGHHLRPGPLRRVHRPGHRL